VDLLRSIYDLGEPVAEPISGRLAAFLTLAHLASPAGKRHEPAPVPVETDLWTVWRCAGSELREVLQRRGELILCPELGTRWSPRAAWLGVHSQPFSQRLSNRSPPPLRKPKPLALTDTQLPARNRKNAAARAAPRGRDRLFSG
jgi:hypothetical protein